MGPGCKMYHAVSSFRLQLSVGSGSAIARRRASTVCPEARLLRAEPARQVAPPQSCLRGRPSGAVWVWRSALTRSPGAPFALRLDVILSHVLTGGFDRPEEPHRRGGEGGAGPPKRLPVRVSAVEALAETRQDLLGAQAAGEAQGGPEGLRGAVPLS